MENKYIKKCKSKLRCIWIGNMQELNFEWIIFISEISIHKKNGVAEINASLLFESVGFLTHDKTIRIQPY